MNPGSLMISPATIRRIDTEKIINKSPVIAPVNNSLPFLTCSALLPPVIIWIVAMSIMMMEIPPAKPVRKVRRAEENPAVEVGIQPRPVLICGFVAELPGHPLVGSMARAAGASIKYRV